MKMFLLESKTISADGVCRVNKDQKIGWWCSGNTAGQGAITAGCCMAGPWTPSPLIAEALGQASTRQACLVSSHPSNGADCFAQVREVSGAGRALTGRRREWLMAGFYVLDWLKLESDPGYLLYISVKIISVKYFKSVWASYSGNRTQTHGAVNFNERP